MAVVQLYKIQMLQDNPYGSLLDGDILDVFIDTSAAVVPAHPLSFVGAGITVEKEGVNYPSSGADSLLLLTENVHYVVHNFGPQACVSTSLLVFNGFSLWPYAYYYSLEDHYSCAINSPTCNLLIYGIPDISPATDATTADGSITVSATSSNPIQYKLGSDFVYNDGSAQTDGFFSGLLPGSYRIFLRDSANCGVNILLAVGVDNTFLPRFRLDYTDLKGNATRIDVTKRGYSGSITEVCAAGDPFEIQLRGEGSTDKFESLLAVQANLNLLSQTDSQFLEIYTNDPNLYRIEYSKNIEGAGLELKTVTKVLPQQYSEEYKAPPYYVSVISTCGLPDLNNFYLIQNDGRKYFGTISLVKLVAHCLSVLKLDLPIRVACNLYSEDMDQTDSDDPFDQAFIDFECFYLAQREPTLSFVLQSILEPFGARITQWEGRWNIVRVEEMKEAYDYRDFDSNGDYIDNGSYDPVVSLDYPDNNGETVLANKDHNLEMRPGYGSLKAIYKLGLKPNILENGDFRLKPVFNGLANVLVVDLDGWNLVNAGYTIEESYEDIEEGNIAYTIKGGGDTDGEAYVQSDTYSIAMGVNDTLKITIATKIIDSTFSFGVITYSPDVPYVKVRVRVKWGTLYLYADGTWKGTANTLTFYANKFNEYQSFEIIAQQPIDGTTAENLDVRVYHAYPYHADFSSKAALKAFATVDLNEGYKTEIKTSEFSGSFVGIYFYKITQSTASNDEFNIIRPNDYHATTNPVQWTRDQGFASFFTTSVLGGLFQANFKMCIDKVMVQFLTNGKATIDSIVRTIPGEAANKNTFEKELIIGSYSNLVVTETNFSLGINWYGPSGSGVLNIITKSILSADLLYTGWLRSSMGVGYEFWTRDGVSESDKLHGILLKSMAAQYKRSWRLLRGSFYAHRYFGFLDVLHEVQTGRIYLPISLTFNDKRCTYSGELLQLAEVGGSSGSGSKAFSSGFTKGFGSKGFN